jgi:hypothetical protein
VSPRRTGEGGFGRLLFFRRRNSRPTPSCIANALVAIAIIALAPVTSANAEGRDTRITRLPTAGTVRFATYNASLNRSTSGELTRNLARGDDAQARTIAQVIQRVRPDVLLVNEFDYDAAGEAAELFQRNYLGVRHDSVAEPITFAHRYSAPVNTGVPTGLDLDRDGRAGADASDAFGFGAFAGQYGMVVFSKLPLDRAAARTFQRLRWAEMPDAAWPDDPVTGKRGGWYSTAQKRVLRLSSKSHWDFPVLLPGGRVVHFLVSHPTPPAFDGPEDRNGRRNHDEIRFWAYYLGVLGRSDRWIRDDAGQRGGLPAAASFVIAGDLNADPFDGSSYRHAVRQLLEHPRLHRDASLGRHVPRSAGAASAAARQGGVNALHRGDPAQDTADFSDEGPQAAGNLRTDYVLPSADLTICGSGVFWPTPDEPERALVNDDTRASSDHRLVWVDVAPDGRCP